MRSLILTPRPMAHICQSLDIGTLAQRPDCMSKSPRNFFKYLSPSFPPSTQTRISWCGHKHVYFSFNFKMYLKYSQVWEFIIYTVCYVRFKIWTRNSLICLPLRGSADPPHTHTHNLGFMTTWLIGYKAKATLCQFLGQVLNNWKCPLSSASKTSFLEPSYHAERKPKQPVGGPYGKWLRSWPRVWLSNQPRQPCEWATLEVIPPAPRRSAPALIT